MAISQPKLELNLLAPNEKFNLSLLDTTVKTIKPFSKFIIVRVLKSPPFYNPTNDSASFALVICTVDRKVLNEWYYSIKGESSGYFQYKNDTVMVYGYKTVDYFFSKIGSKKQFDLLNEPYQSRDLGPVKNNLVIYIYSKGKYKLIEPYKRSYPPPSNLEMADKLIQKTIVINAPAAKVWEAITNSKQTKEWWSDSTVEVKDNWERKSNIIFNENWDGSLYHDNKALLAFEKGKLLKFNYLSQSSKLSDVIKTPTTIEFSVKPLAEKTILQLTQSGLMTDAIYQHWNFYWQVTLDILKKFIEQ